MDNREEVASMRRKAKQGKSSRAKTKLGLPDLEQAKSAVLVSLRSPESQRSYRRSIQNFVCWYCSEPRLSFNKAVVTRYRVHLEDRLLAPGTINVRLPAVRRLAYEAADNGLLPRRSNLVGYVQWGARSDRFLLVRQSFQQLSGRNPVWRLTRHVRLLPGYAGHTRSAPGRSPPAKVRELNWKIGVQGFQSGGAY